MSELVRFGVSLERNLLTAFDRHSERKGFANRSEALRHCIRRELAEEIVSDPDAPVAGVLTLVYDHHDNDLPGRLIPVPTVITAGCGLAWAVDPTGKEVVLTMMEREGIRAEGVYDLVI